MRLRPALAAIAVTGLLAGSCGGSERAVKEPQPGIALLSNTTGTSDPAAATTMARADAGFAGALYRRLAAGDENLVMSPLSIASVLQMLSFGAQGQTATQLQQVLKVPGVGPERLAGQVAALRASLAVLAKDKQVHTADAIWTQDGLAIKKPFSSALHKAFAAKALGVDFRGDADGSRKQINSAIADATNGKIENLIGEGVIDDLTRVVLTDAIYLNAKWAHPFDPKDTEDRTFTRADGSTVKAPTMHSSGMLSYAQKNGYQVATLPYAGGRMSMQILLPSGPLAPLEQRLQTDGLAALTGGQSSQRVELSLPRWDFTAAPDLKPALTAMGMGDAFDPDKADLSGITGKERLYLKAVVHKAMIKVGEKGTEAAAATAGVAGATAAPVTDAQMLVDRPFVFAITDTATHTPLFLGRVTDPSAH